MSFSAPTQQMKVEGDCCNTIAEREEGLIVVDWSIYSDTRFVSGESLAVLSHDTHIIDAIADLTLASAGL